MKQKLTKLLLLMLTLFVAVGNVEAKKVHTLGDSTMAPYDENATNTRGWGMYFGNFLTNGWTSVNYAKGGRDSRGGFNELWQNAKNNVEAGDYVLIQFAHNDGKYNGIDNLELQAYYTGKGDATNANAVKSDGRGTTPSTTYKACLKQIIDAVKEKGATPILVSAVCRCYFTNGVAPITRVGRHDLGNKFDALVNGEYKTGQKVDEDNHIMDYSYQMEQLAQEENVDFIDMTTATKNLYESYGTYDKCYAALFDKGAETDNTHYNLTGALMAARLCAQLMKDKGILADNIEIPTDLSIAPSPAEMGDVYVGQSAIKELTLTGLGLEPAVGTITITASEGIQLSTDKQNWTNTLEASYESGTVIKTFYAKVAATAAGVFNGTVTATLGEKQVAATMTMNAIELGGGAPFTVTWPLTGNDNPSIDGSVNAATAKVEGMVKYNNDGTKGLMVSTSDGGAWVKAEDDSPNQYVQFTVTCPDGQKVDINQIALKVGAWGGNGMCCHIYYSTDGFVTRNTIFDSGKMTNKEVYEVSASPVIKLEEGDQLQVRVYPWYTSDVTGKWLCVSNVVIGGQSKDASGVNIPGTISYKLDKGGLNQGDDAVMDPNELSAGFAGKTWSAGSSLTVKGTSNYRGAAGEANILQTSIVNKTGASLSSTAGADNTLTLTLTPEDGFSFVPTKLSFEASRYGTDGGNISAAIAAGTTSVDLVNNAAVNRDNNGLTVQSFSEEVSGVTATADQPLKVNFSFLGLGDTKTMGLSNVVIEGTLVGAAAQVTKYALNTQVLPSAEAGSITREPELEMYKEGAVVTLKATKNFGYKFKEWQDADGNQVSTDAETTVTMDGEKTMKAVFEQVNVYKVSTKVANDAERDGLGSVTLTPNDHNGQYEEGTKITATANESKIIKFLSWTDENENANAGKERELTVNGDMTLVANYEVQDFIAVFDASKTAAYDYAGKPFSADEVWDNQRNAKSCIVKQSDATLVYTKDGGTPVVRNRQSVVLSTINGLYQNGYNTAEIAWQYQFSTVGFTSATFTADMAAKNAATKNWKAQYSVDGTTYNDLGEAWQMTANVATPLSLPLPADAIGKETVYVRIMGTGTELLSEKYAFTAGEFCGLKYTTNSESGVGNVYVLGTAVVVADETAPVVTATIPANDATGVSATGRITISFDERIESANSNAAVTLNDKVLTPTWNSRSVSFDYTGLDYNAAYTFTMPANYVQDRSGNKLAEAVVISFTTMQRPTIAKAMYDFIVPDNGTIDEALAAANGRADKNVRYRVFIKNSADPYVFHPAGKVTGGDGKEYDNPISILSAPNTSFIGESLEGVVLTNVTPAATWNNGYGDACPLEGIGNGDVLQIKGQNSYFQNLTIKTSMGDAHGRDIAVNDQSTRTIFKDACLWGYQDTWKSGNGLYYFEGGVIRGRTDFLCGGGDAFLNQVDIVMCEQGGYIVAPQGNSKYGYVFKDCTIKGEKDNVSGTYYLGRAWTSAAETYFIDTKMEALPANAAWHDWNNGPTRFAEYNSMTASGTPIDLSGRATSINDTENKPILTEEEAATIGNMVNTFGDWQPTLLTEQAPVPTNVQADGAVLTWEDSDYALLYAIVKDGEVIAFTTEATYTAKENGQYSVRAANEMGGLSEPSAAVVVADVTGIATVGQQHTTTVEAIYTADGKRISKPQQGLNIIRMTDGTTRKVVIK